MARRHSDYYLARAHKNLCALLLQSKKDPLLLQSQIVKRTAGLQQHKLWKKLRRCGTSRKVCLSYFSCWLSKVLENIFFKVLAKAEKSALPLHPASIGGEKVEKQNERKLNFFLEKLDKSKSLLTFALPNRKKGNKITKDIG